MYMGKPRKDRAFIVIFGFSWIGKNGTNDRSKVSDQMCRFQDASVFENNLLSCGINKSHERAKLWL